MYNEGMRRVLLVIEDYNELLFAEKVLKKVGFDIESLHSESPLLDKMIGFLPDLVVATGNGQRVDGKSVVKKVKRKGGVQAKLLLLFNPQRSQKRLDYESYGAEGFLEAPVNPRTLIKTVCDLTGLPSEPVVAKFDKLAGPDEENQMQVVSNKGVEEKKTDLQIISNKGRTESYSKFLKSVPKSDVELFDHKAVESERRYQKKHPDTPEELRIDEEKKVFVKKLYKDWKR
jgi:DNA-binding response OmpR family regulator